MVGSQSIPAIGPQTQKEDMPVDRGVLNSNYIFGAFDSQGDTSESWLGPQLGRLVTCIPEALTEHMCRNQQH